MPPLPAQYAPAPRLDRRLTNATFDLGGDAANQSPIRGD
jgi:hypothetical protein